VATNKDHEAEERLRELQRSLRAVADRLEGRSKREGRSERHLYRWRAAVALAILAGAIVVAGFMNSPWASILSSKHLAAFPSCDAVPAMGLTPVRQGQPRYWRGHDQDDDGVVCEPAQEFAQSVPAHPQESAPDDGYSTIKIINGKILRREGEAIAAPNIRISPDRHAIIEIENGKVRRSKN